MKKTLTIFLIILGVLFGLSIADGGRTVKLVAQAAFMRGMASGATRGWAVPAYLKSCNYSATTTANNCHDGPTVVGCVVINSAGAASSTIKLYDSANNAWAGCGAGAACAGGVSWASGTPAPSTLRRTIDATKVGSVFCYADLFKGGLTVVITSAGAAPDTTITYQGQ